MTSSPLLTAAKATFTVSSPHHVFNWGAVGVGIAAFFNVIPWPQIAAFMSVVWILYSLVKEYRNAKGK